MIRTPLNLRTLVLAAAFIALLVGPLFAQCRPGQPCYYRSQSANVGYTQVQVGDHFVAGQPYPVRPSPQAQTPPAPPQQAAPQPQS